MQRLLPSKQTSKQNKATQSKQTSKRKTKIKTTGCLGEKRKEPDSKFVRQRSCTYISHKELKHL